MKPLVWECAHGRIVIFGDGGSVEWPPCVACRHRDVGGARMAEYADEPMGMLSMIDDETDRTCTCAEPVTVRLVEGRPWLAHCPCGCPYLVPKQRAVLT